MKPTVLIDALLLAVFPSDQSLLDLGALFLGRFSCQAKFKIYIVVTSCRTVYTSFISRIFIVCPLDVVQ